MGRAPGIALISLGLLACSGPASPPSLAERASPLQTGGALIALHTPAESSDRSTLLAFDLRDPAPRALATFDHAEGWPPPLAIGPARGPAERGAAGRQVHLARFPPGGGAFDPAQLLSATLGPSPGGLRFVPGPAVPPRQAPLPDGAGGLVYATHDGWLEPVRPGGQAIEALSLVHQPAAGPSRILAHLELYLLWPRAVRGRSLWVHQVGPAGTSVVRYDLDGGPPLVLWKGQGSLREVQLTPEGGHLVWERTQGTRRTVERLAVDDTAARPHALLEVASPWLAPLPIEGGRVLVSLDGDLAVVEEGRAPRRVPGLPPGAPIAEAAGAGRVLVRVQAKDRQRWLLLDADTLDARGAVELATGGGLLTSPSFLGEVLR